MTLRQVSSSHIFLWYSHIDVNKSVEVIQKLYDDSKKHQIFYPLYSKKERLEDPSKENTGLFFFKGKDYSPFAICNAGGGFMYVGALHDSFPHALELSKRGFSSFVLIYRIEHPYQDLARAIAFLYDHSEEFKIDKNHYSLWGGSAGARMAARLGNKKVLASYVGNDIPQADAIIMQYTGYSYVSKDDAPTYANGGYQDGIADYRIIERRTKQLKSLSIDAMCRIYPGLSHGFGLGEHSVAKGWINEAIDFWVKQIKVS